MVVYKSKYYIIINSLQEQNYSFNYFLKAGSCKQFIWKKLNLSVYLLQLPLFAGYSKSNGSLFTSTKSS